MGKIFITVVGVFLLFSFPLQGQDAEVYFRQGKAELDLNYKENRKNLTDLLLALRAKREDKSQKLEAVEIYSGASPEGNTALNQQLSDKRAENMASYLIQNGGINRNIIRIYSKGTDWDGLLKLVERSQMPYKEEVIDILKNTPEWIKKDGKVIDGRKKQLMELEDSQPWLYMLANFFPQLRSSGQHIECKFVKDTVVMWRTNYQKDTVIIYDTVRVVKPRTAKAQKPLYLALKTNGLYDLALLPNIAAEVYLCQGYSISGSWAYTWFKNDTKHKYWRMYGGEVEGRYWLRQDLKPLTGSHVGVYIQALTYDFEFKHKGALNRFAMGVGVSYGYSKPIAKFLNLDFSIGVGYLGGKYKKYEPSQTTANEYVWLANKKLRWFGPTKAEVSLVWLLGRDNYNKKEVAQ